MITVKQFMCYTDLMVGCVIIGLINAVLSCIFFFYTCLDIYYHNAEREGGERDYYGGWKSMIWSKLEAFHVIKAFLFLIYLLHFIHCLFLIAAALKKSTKYVKRYVIISIITTFATFIEGCLIFIYGGATEMALNYFAFSLWNIYFIIVVNSFYLKFKNQSQRMDDYERGEALEAL